MDDTLLLKWTPFLIPRCSSLDLSPGLLDATFRVSTNSPRPDLFPVRILFVVSVSSHIPSLSLFDLIALCLFFFAVSCGILIVVINICES